MTFGFPRELLSRFTSRSDSRTALLQKNVAATFAAQGISMVANLVLIRVTIEYLGATEYGVWITLSSIFTWFNVLNAGLSGGLRNKLAESIAKNDDKMGRVYVSTTYALMMLISGGLFVVFLIANAFINWSKVLNTSPAQTHELGVLALWLFGLFCLKLTVNVINSVLAADQRPAYSNIFSVGAVLVSLVGMPLLFYFTSRSLISVGLLMAVPPVALALGGSVYFLRGRYRRFAPALRYVNFSHARELMTLGLQFFVLQICAVVVFSTDNVIISQLLGPRAVTPYAVALKYFTVIGLMLRIAYGPLWSAFTDSHVKGDVQWIRKATRGANRLWFMSILGVLVLIAVSHPVYRLLAGNTVEIPWVLTFLMGLFTIQSGWNNIYSFFLNGISKIRLQVILAVLAALANIPLSIFLAGHLGLGSSGVILATILCLFPLSIVQPIQYSKLIGGTATGIFNK